MRLTTGLFLPLILAAASAAAPVQKTPADPPAGPAYYPTAVGTKWVYEQNGREVTWEVTAAESTAGETLVTINQTIAGGEAETIAKASVSARGVFQFQIGPFKVDPVCELRFPLKARDSWTIDIPQQLGGLQGTTATLTVGDLEQVEVPAGRFKAIRMDVVVTAENGKPLAEPKRGARWYAPGVGLVKLTFGKDFTRELKTFTPGKK